VVRRQITNVEYLYTFYNDILKFTIQPLKIYSGERSFHNVPKDAQAGSRGIPIFQLQLGDIGGRARPLFPRGRAPVPAAK
jgi:hypothetical protein